MEIFIVCLIQKNIVTVTILIINNKKQELKNKNYEKREQILTVQRLNNK